MGVEDKPALLRLSSDLRTLLKSRHSLSRSGVEAEILHFHKLLVMPAASQRDTLGDMSPTVT